jgi:hypothetical protein
MDKFLALFHPTLGILYQPSRIFDMAQSNRDNHYDYIQDNVFP